MKASSSSSDHNNLTVYILIYYDQILKRSHRPNVCFWQFENALTKFLMYVVDNFYKVVCYYKEDRILKSAWLLNWNWCIDVLFISFPVVTRCFPFPSLWLKFSHNTFSPMLLFSLQTFLSGKVLTALLWENRAKNTWMQ